VNDGIPPPIVALNRWTIVAGVVLAVALRAPLFTTALFVIIAAAALFGRRGSLIFIAGSTLLRPAIARARAAGRTDDPTLTRFNNILASVLLGLAQLAFLAHVNTAGWILSIAPAVAAAVALAGYCVGCTLFYRFKAARFHVFGR
jgi:hypothetical protein